MHIRGIYYSAIDGSRNSNTAQFIELTPIFDLIEWYQALQAARDAGCLLQLSDRLEELVTTLFKGGIRDTSLPRAGLKSLSLNIGSVFPLEVGIASSRVCEVLDGIAECYPQNIAGRLALRSLREQLEHWRIAPDETTLGPHIKKELLQNRLSEDELRRQLRLAHWYYDHDNIPAVLLLLREWLVSLVIFAATEGKESWLNTDDTNSVREKWEAFPYHVKARREAGLTISAFEEKLEKTWHEVSSRRNKFAHAGMTIKDISVSEEKVKELLFSCEELLTTCEQLLAMNSRLFWDNNRQSKLLICSLGQSPGVVYSALMHCRPDKLLVVASEQSQHSLQAALEAAEMASIEHRTLCMTDHVGGFNEHKSLIDQSVRQMLGNAREVIGSITGGTTAMQYTVERLIAQAKNFGPTVTTIALLDRRSRVEQQNQPYVLSDIIELETRKCMLEQQMEEVLVLN